MEDHDGPSTEPSERVWEYNVKFSLSGRLDGDRDDNVEICGRVFDEDERLMRSRGLAVLCRCERKTKGICWTELQNVVDG